MTLRLAFIGCVDFSYGLLEGLIDRQDIKLVGIVTRQSSSFNADFKSLEPLARSRDIPVFLADDNNQFQMATFLKECRPDVIFCFGWSYLLKDEVLRIPARGVFGYHPTLLPQNRGRHPLIWALALGLKETGSTFFLMDAGADSGPIAKQARVKISNTDNAASLYAKMMETAKSQVQELTNDLVENRLTLTPQDESKATYWRKRSKADGEIDWTKPTCEIHNLVRALSKPYVGAHCLYRQQDAKVWASKAGTTIDQTAKPGYVLSITDHVLEIKTGDGSILLLDHELTPLPKEGETL